MFSNNQKKEEAEREMLFQKRIAELGFQRQAMPWMQAEKPIFDLPVEETKFFSEGELEEGVTDEEVERRIVMDLLSQTYNFRTFYKRLHYELKRAARYKRALSLLLVGIDRLEDMAKQYGPDAAHHMIKSAAKILLSSIRDVDIAGRCREDTFGVILPETGLEGSEIAAERIRTKLDKHSITFNWQTVQMTASVGVTCFPGTASGVDEFFAQAAEALLSGMQKGGNALVYAKK